LLLALAPTANAQAVDKLLKSADQHASDGRLNAARTEYERAMRSGAHLEQDFARSRFLGLCYLNGTPHDFPKAAQWLGNAVRLNAASEEMRLAFARALAWSGRFDESVAQYRVLIAAQPENPDYVLGLSNTLSWKKDSAGAIAVLEQYLEKFPSSISMRLEYARTLSFAQRFPEAMNQYQVVLQADPKNVNAQVGIAKVTSWQGQLPAALEMYNRILQRHPENFEAQAGKGFVLMWMQRKEEARASFLTAQRIDGSDPEVRNALKELAAAMPARRPAPLVARATPAPPPAAAAKTIEPPPTFTTKLPRVADVPVLTALPDEATRLTAEAEVAAAKQDYPKAIEDYRRILALDPANQPARLQLARVLSWSKQYDESGAEYEALLKAKPEALEYRAERARVLSWGKNYEQSLAEYRELLQALEAGADHTLNLGAEGIEYVRVLSWARKYQESLAYADTLLARNDLEQKQRGELLLTKARVLAWSRKYPDSISMYELAEKNGADAREVRLGIGQTLYWSGELQRSRTVLTQLLQEHKSDPDASFTLAAVEHGLGHNAKSLQLLRVVPDNKDSRELRSSLREALRPELRLRFGFEDDNDIAPAPSPATATKVLRYGTTLAFSAHPDVRMEIANTTSQSLTSNSVLSTFGSGALINETLARATFAVNPWLRMTLGAGAAVTHSAAASPGMATYFIYDLHPVILNGPWRVDLSFTRRAADYTPLAVHDGVTFHREAVAVTYDFRHRLRLNAEYGHAMYAIHVPGRPELGPVSNSGSVSMVPTWILGEKVRLDAGARYDIFGFGHDSRLVADPASGPGSAGFFAPGLFHRPSAVAHFIWQMPHAFTFDSEGSFGPQRVSTPTGPKPRFGPAGSFGVQLAKNMKQSRPFVRYDYFDTQTAASPAQQNGAYRSQVITFGMDIRF